MDDYFLSIVKELWPKAKWKVIREVPPNTNWRIWPIDLNVWMLDSGCRLKIIVDAEDQKMWRAGDRIHEYHFNFGSHESVILAFKEMVEYVTMYGF